MSDPFRHDPDLRGRIADAETSFYRKLDVAGLDAMFAQLGMPSELRIPDAVREAERRAFLGSRARGDLWVFAYGSLMWDPALHFAEVRRARLPGHARRLILKETRGARGDRERPGLMVTLDALDGAPDCEGLVFRIAAERVEEETFVLWRRERFAAGYRPGMVRAETAAGPVDALAFLADHEADVIEPGLTRREQVAFAASGRGLLGSTLDYLRILAHRLADLGLEDGAIDEILSEAEARSADGRKGHT